MSRMGGTPRSRRVAAVLGGAVGCALMGVVAFSHGTDMAVGASAGAIQGAMLGYGVEAGSVSPVTLFAVLFALVGAAVGPGFDDYVGILAVFGALVGGLIGLALFGIRRGRRPSGRSGEGRMN